MINKYPYTDFHEINLDWILREIMKLHHEYDEFRALNTITNAGAWDITKQYQAWTIVSDNNAGYISLKPVPAGIAITNTEYWGLIADYDILITDLSNRISALESDVSTLNNQITTKLYKDQLDILNTILRIKDTPRIKVIGDSVGLGADATGFGEDPAGAITWQIPGDVHREGYKSVPCWVNYLRKACLNMNPNTEFLNMSINGMSATEMNPKKTAYEFGAHNDIIFVCVGINDMHQAADISVFDTNYTELIQYFKTQADHVVLITPTLYMYENIYGTGENVQLTQICSTIKKVARELDCAFVDLNKALSQRYNRNSLMVYAYLNDYPPDVVHPSDCGHFIIWNELSCLLGIDYPRSELMNYKVFYEGSISLESGATNSDYYGEDHCRVVSTDGVNATLTLGIVFDNTFSGTTIGTLPVGFAPALSTVGTLTYRSSGGTDCIPIPIVINSNRTLETVGPMVTPSYAYATISYPLMQHTTNYPSITY